MEGLPRVPILEPCSGDLCILLIDCQSVILKMSLQLVSKQQARSARAYANDLNVPFCMYRPV